MPVYVRDAGTWKQFPTTPANTRLLWVRAPPVGEWKAASALFVRDADVWKQEPEYVGLPVAPTNFRVTSVSTDYGGVTFEWDYTGLVAPAEFRIYIYDYGSSSANTPMMEMYVEDPGARSFRYNCGPSQYVSATLAAVSITGSTIFFGGAATNPGKGVAPKWKTGASSYVVNDVPIYGWGPTFEHIPALSFASSQFDASHTGQHSRDNNTGTQWISVGHGTSGTVNDWEGCAYKMPYTSHCLYVGLRVIQGNGPCYVSHGVFHNGTWKGSINHAMAVPPVFSFLDHNYISYYNVAMDQYLYEGGYVTDGGSSPSGNLVAVTLGTNVTTHPSIGMGYFASIKEVRMLLQNWVVTSYGPRTVAAVPSGAW